jgi:predicted phage terminase large subunit-like protein
VRDEWRDSEILIKDRKQPRAEPSISTAGLDSTITSKHYDIIICDDLVNQDDRDSVAKRRASIKYIDDLVDLLDKRHGFCLFVGTPWHWEDAYQYIEKTLNPKLKSKVQREVVIHKEPIYEDTPKGRVYNFPEIFPPKKVEEIRNMKSDAANFAANYLLKPIHPDSQIFKFENFQFFNYGRDIGKVREVWCHIDPAGSGVQGDYTAMVLLGKRLDDNRVLILEAWIDQLRPSDREERVYVLWQFYAALKWADPAEGGKKKDIEQHWQVETVANQDEVRRSLVDFMVEKKKVADFPLSGKSRVANKTAKITNLELPVTNGTLLFRDDWETAPNGYRILIDQLLNFPLGHDDGPDALKEAFDLTQKNDVFVASL